MERVCHDKAGSLMKLPSYNQFKLRDRIFFGFGVSGVLTILLILLVVRTGSQVNSSFKEFIRLSNTVNQEIQLSDWVRDMQRNVQNFIIQDHSSSFAEVSRLYSLVKDSLEERHKTSQQQERIETILTHLDNYYESFQEVVSQRRRRKLLLEETLPEYSNRIEKSFEQLSQLSGHRPSILQLSNQYLLSEKNLYRYLDTLDKKYFDEAKSLSDEAEKRMGIEIRRSGAGPLSRELMKTRDLLKSHRETYIEAVQITRSYLFLVNVVMAAEAYEVLYQVSDLGVVISDQKDKREVEIVESTETLNHRLIIAAIIMVALGGIIVIRTIRSITSPVLNLAGLFQKLSDGEEDVNIPEYKIADEIGVLSHAAAVFQEKNMETRRLLKESQEMSNDLQERDRELNLINRELEDRVAEAVAEVEAKDKIIFDTMRERSVSDLLINIAHHWRQPLNVIALNAQNIEDILDFEGGDREQITDRIETIVKTTIKLSDIITRFSRIQARVESDDGNQNFNFVEVLEIATELLAPQMSRYSVKVETEIDPEIMLIKSKRHFIDIFVTFLSNVIDVGKNRRIPDPLLLIRAMRVEDDIEIDFEDNVGGIDPDIKAFLFDPYQTTGFKGEGKGLSLFFVKRIIEDAMGGSIHIEEIPEGTRFKIRIPNGK